MIYSCINPFASPVDYKFIPYTVIPVADITIDGSVSDWANSSKVLITDENENDGKGSIDSTNQGETHSQNKDRKLLTQIRSPCQTPSQS